MKRKLQLAVATSAIFAAGLAIGQGVDPRVNPNIAEAQRYCHMAYDKVIAAQRANGPDMGGHAENAKNLLRQAAEDSQESRLATSRGAQQCNDLPRFDREVRKSNNLDASAIRLRIRFLNSAGFDDGFRWHEQSPSLLYTIQMSA